MYTWWVHNRLGKGVRKVIPSCALWAIHDKYPEPNCIFIPFKIDEEPEANVTEK